MREQYRKELDTYSAPLDLLCKTKVNMQRELNKTKSVTFTTNRFPVMLPSKIMIGIAAVAVFSTIIFEYVKPVQIVSPLESGTHLPIVELTSGELKFEENSRILVAEQGNIVQSNSENSEINIALFKNKYLLFKENPLFREMNSSYLIEESEDGEKTAIGYSSEFSLVGDKGIIRVTAGKKANSTTEIPNSQIGKTPVFLSWNPMTRNYVCEFKVNEIAYTIHSENTAQEQFIQFLLLFLENR